MRRWSEICNLFAVGHSVLRARRVASIGPRRLFTAAVKPTTERASLSDGSRPEFAMPTGISIADNVLRISETALLDLSLRKLAERLHQTGCKHLSLSQSALNLLGIKAVQDVSEFESFINLFALGMLDSGRLDLSPILMKWNQKNKNIREIVQVLVELSKGKSAVLVDSFSSEFIEYVVNGLCFIKRPLDALNLLELYIQSLSANGQCADMHVAVSHPQVQEMCKLVLVAFIIQESPAMVDVLWVKVNSWYQQTGIPVKLATKFAKYYADNGQPTNSKVKIDFLYEMWLKNSDLYDAQFYGELCYAFAKLNSFFMLERLIMNCPYGELNGRAVGMLVKQKLDMVGVDGMLSFLSTFLAFIKTKGITVNPLAFSAVAKAVGRRVEPELMRSFVQLLERDGHMLIDSNLLTAMYEGMKATRSISVAQQRRDCVEIIRTICQDNGLKILVS